MTSEKVAQEEITQKPSIKKPRKRSKLVMGVGINDSIEPVNKTIISKSENGSEKKAIEDPIYVMWKNVLTRCYSKKYNQDRFRTKFTRFTVCEEWLTFSKFKQWAIDNDAISEDGKRSDLVFTTSFFDRHCTHYSPETCAMIPDDLNRFMHPVSTNSLPIGVYVDKRASTNEHNKYTGCVYDPIERNEKTGKHTKHRVGVHANPVEAHFAWKRLKHEYALQLANIEMSKGKNCDERIVKALKTRFSEDSEWLLASRG